MLGCRVAGFTNPDEALREFHVRPCDFDVVVTGLVMPHMSGSDLVRKLRLVRPEIPIILITRCVRPEDRVTAKELGIHEVLAKPCRIEDLTGALERVTTERSSAAGNSSV